MPATSFGRRSSGRTAGAVASSLPPWVTRWLGGSATSAPVSTSVTPSAAALRNVYTYKLLDDAEEKQWNEIFQKVVSG